MQEINEEIDEEIENDDDENNEEVQNDETNKRDRTNERYSLRSDPKPSKKAIEGGNQFIQVQNLRINQNNDTMVEAQKEITKFILTQYTADKGIKRFGQPAVDTLMKEFCQLEKQSVFEPVLSTNLTREERNKALRFINLVEEKRSVVVRSALWRAQADGQR